MESPQAILMNAPRRHPLRWRLAALVLLKVAVLLLIRHLWFSAPPAWQGHEAATADHMLAPVVSSSAVSSSAVSSSAVSSSAVSYSSAVSSSRREPVDDRR